jgi:hypothetical protein
MYHCCVQYFCSTGLLFSEPDALEYMSDFPWRIWIFWSIAGSLLLSGCLGRGEPPSGYQDLRKAFVNPPDSTKPWVYWYWISDHISREGITRDLEMMAELGIGAGLIGNIFLPEITRGKVPVLSDGWYDHLRFALAEGSRLGVDIGIFNGPGWVQSGGPWIDHRRSMRYLVSHTEVVEGPGVIRRLAGGGDSTSQLVAWIAWPADDTEVPDIASTTWSARTMQADLPALFDEDLSTFVRFPVDEMEEEPLTIDVEFSESQTFRSVTLHPASEPFSVDFELLAWEDDAYRPVCRGSIDRTNAMLTVGPLTYGPVVRSFPAQNSRKWRLKFSGLNQKKVWFADVKRGGGLAEIGFSSLSRLEDFVEKQLGKMHQLPTPAWHDYQWPQQVEYTDTTGYPDPSRVLDLTGQVQDDGTLVWEVPHGKWNLHSYSMKPTGVTNAPVSAEGLGLDVDKMQRRYVQDHFDTYLGPLIRQLGPEEKKAFKYLVIDSYETGSQNWTDDLRETFKRKYGYDPLPWLPVISREIVGNADRSDRFLWDLRRLVADQISYEYVGGLHERARENGLKLWVENYGHWGFPGEFLQYGGQADLVSGEFWIEDDLGTIECRAAASASHIYGKTQVFAESYTAARKHFSRSPGQLRQRGDWSFAQGVNHQVLHVYIQQPYNDTFPGINAWFGVEFNRQNTWFPKAKSWIDYLRRNHLLLQQGDYQADICYFIGEGAPLMTGIEEPPVPPGYSFDFINAEVILRDLYVENHRLTLPNGMSYALMVLPPLETMTPALLQKIRQLVGDGANMMGVPPHKSPGMAGYPESDELVRSLAEEMWGQHWDGNTIRSFGSGRILPPGNLSEALMSLEVTPDIILSDPDSILWIHRRKGATEIYFLSNQSHDSRGLMADFRVQDKQPELWDAVTGEQRLLPQFSSDAGRTQVLLWFNPGESYYLLFSDKPQRRHTGPNFPDYEEVAVLSESWQVRFDPKLKGPQEPVEFRQLTDWSTHENEQIRFYSGPAVYARTIQLEEPAEGERYYLSLGRVSHLARVFIDKKAVGGVWTEPARIEITGELTGSQQLLEIEVTSTWVNRMIGDRGLPEDERITWAAENPYRPGDPLQSSGLLGPVKILKQVN